VDFVEISADTVAKAETSETGRRRIRIRRRLFLVPRPGATLSHQIKSKN
jgi:hypothetical protein